MYAYGYACGFEFAKMFTPKVCKIGCRGVNESEEFENEVKPLNFFSPYSKDTAYGLYYFN
jgi:hypothetical protein